jgi:hypothetical protein
MNSSNVAVLGTVLGLISLLVPLPASAHVASATLASASDACDGGVRAAAPVLTGFEAVRWAESTPETRTRSTRFPTTKAYSGCAKTARFRRRP